ncbi:GntR family transcriptional regulator [Aquibium sp. A9E412]|uniref:GntR family transcriptional regulator n=1 Tax=Aquibium sp. A9E412 TaxID=2976767 RepID=UPI0025B08E12|nr:GntR family transcriptional regulator [Aquibium sp. A9E412]MDN2567109.1 GntR family transcriptional regulator [Aquibium sp. A9E412]
MSASDLQPQIGLGEQAYKKIKDDIVWCRLRPGDEVSEARLCELYGFGKAPVRQALSRLAQEAYVVSQPRRGHVIAPVTLKTVRELFELRSIVEPATAELACGRVDRDRLVALDARCVEGYVPGDVASEARFVAANNAFHLEIARAANNSRLTGLLAQILDEMTRLLHLGYVLRERPHATRAEHEELIEALVAGDRAAARACTLAHIESVRGMVMDGIAKHSSLSEANIAPIEAGALERP